MTQTVTGQLKDILVLLLGVLMFGDVPFSPLNAVGVILSIVGSFVYASTKYHESKPASPHPPKLEKVVHGT